jgi:hypothetical protein
MSATDRLLLDPTDTQLREALDAVWQQLCPEGNPDIGMCPWPPDDLAQVLARLRGLEAGWHVWWLTSDGLHRGPLSLGVWTDYAGRRHYRVVNENLDLTHGPGWPGEENLHCLLTVYPRQTLWLPPGWGNRRPGVVCSCGAMDQPEALAWMGRQCGPCHDLAEAGEPPPPPDRFAAHKSEVIGLAFSPDGRALVSLGRDRQVKLWEVANRQQHAHWEVECLSACPMVSFSPDGSLIAWVDGDHPDVVLQPFVGGPLRRVPGSRFVFLPRDEGLITLTEGELVLWHPQTWRPDRHFRDQPAVCARAIAVSPDGLYLATAGERAVVTWDVVLAQPVHRDPDLRGASLLAYAPVQGERLLAVGLEDRLVLVDGRTPGRAQRRVSAAAGCFVPGRKQLFTLRQDRLEAWRVPDLEHGCTLRDGTRLTAVACSPDSRLVACGREDGVVRLWPAELLAP